MSAEQTPLTLTCPSLNFSFTEFEVPETIRSFGGVQSHALHRYPGGRQAIQTFGAFPHDGLRWSGIIQGPNTRSRALLLDSIRSGGQQCTLSFDVWKYAGILSDLKIDLRNTGWVPYEAEFTPSEDQTQAGPYTASQSPEASFSGLSSQLSNQIVSYDGSNPTILAALPQINSVLSVVTSSISGAGGTLAAVAPSALSQQVTAINALVTTLEPVGPVPPVTASANYVAGLVATDAAMSDLLWQQQTVYLLQELGYLLTIPPAQPRLIMVINPCLLVLASQLYGDPAQWPTLSQANNNFPIFAIGTYSLVAPAAPTVAAP